MNNKSLCEDCYYGNKDCSMDMGRTASCIKFRKKEKDMNASTSFTLGDLLKWAGTNKIPMDAWINFRDSSGSLIEVKSIRITDRDPETGDIDLILEDKKRGK